MAHSSVLMSRHARHSTLGQQMRREECRSRFGIQVTRLPIGRERPDDVFDDRIARAQCDRQCLEVRAAFPQLIGSLLDDGPWDMHLDGGQD
ncbi:predicted protein [Streptomyces iranensis]|uniref:Uncharacterized protein n=1 Tax=Streptomyces iranensis TaxID=576784 RepID=A0A060ZG58_9ACTN|nr:predicted protein [Streptomyces iranensis]